jgi:hypothetical protein
VDIELTLIQELKLKLQGLERALVENNDENKQLLEENIKRDDFSIITYFSDAIETVMYPKMMISDF